MSNAKLAEREPSCKAANKSYKPLLKKQHKQKKSSTNSAVKKASVGKPSKNLKKGAKH